jgi:uncharacterized protein YcbK (DUF882 family)
MNLKHFSPSEFRCRCGCGLGMAEMDRDLLIKLDHAREIAGVPMVISSAIRCKAHNQTVGGVRTSSHLKGLATDILTPNNATRSRILKGLVAVGLGERIGIHPDFVHVDVDMGKPAPCAWLYKK